MRTVALAQALILSRLKTAHWAVLPPLLYRQPSHCGAPLAVRPLHGGTATPRSAHSLPLAHPSVIWQGLHKRASPPLPNAPVRSARSLRLRLFGHSLCGLLSLRCSLALHFTGLPHTGLPVSACSPCLLRCGGSRQALLRSRLPRRWGVHAPAA